MDGQVHPEHSPPSGQINLGARNCSLDIDGANQPYKNRHRPTSRCPHGHLAVDHWSLRQVPPALLVVTIAVSLPARREAKRRAPDSSPRSNQLICLCHRFLQVTGFRRHLHPREWTSPIRRIKFTSTRVRRLLLRLSPSGWSSSAPCTVRLGVQSTLRDGGPAQKATEIHRLCSCPTHMD